MNKFIEGDRVLIKGETPGTITAIFHVGQRTSYKVKLDATQQEFSYHPNALTKAPEKETKSEPSTA